MAKRSKSNFSDYKFRYVTFSQLERDQFKHWIDSHKYDVIDLLLVFADNQTKLSCSYDSSKEAYTVTFTIKNSESPHYNCVYMFKHEELDRCIAIAAHYFIEHMSCGDMLVMDSDDLSW